MSKKDYLKYFEFKRDCVVDDDNSLTLRRVCSFFEECGFTDVGQIYKEKNRRVVRKYITDQMNKIFYSLPENEQFELMMQELHPTDCPLWKTEQNDCT